MTLKFSDFINESIQLNDITFNINKVYNHKDDTIILRLKGATREDSKRMLDLNTEQTKIIFNKIKSIFKDIKLDCTFKFYNDWQHVQQGNETKQIMGTPFIDVKFNTFEVINSLAITLQTGIDDLKTQGMGAKDFFEHE